MGWANMAKNVVMTIEEVVLEMCYVHNTFFFNFQLCKILLLLSFLTQVLTMRFACKDKYIPLGQELGCKLLFKKKLHNYH